MNFYKINNLVNNGQCDYKGLNIDLIIAGTQVYPHDLSINNICLVGSSEDLVTSTDLIKLTETEYSTLKAEIIAAIPTPQPSKEEVLEQRVLELENTILLMQGVI